MFAKFLTILTAVFTDPKSLLAVTNACDEAMAAYKAKLEALVAYKTAKPTIEELAADPDLFSALMAANATWRVGSYFRKFDNVTTAGVNQHFLAQGFDEIWKDLIQIVCAAEFLLEQLNTE